MVSVSRKFLYSGTFGLHMWSRRIRSLITVERLMEAVHLNRSSQAKCDQHMLLGSKLTAVYPFAGNPGSSAFPVNAV